MLDRARFPRNKPCGGAISMRAIARFPWLAGALTRIPTHRLSTLYLEGPSGAGVTMTSPGPAALMIRRVEFDHLLAQLAVEAGAELIEDVEVGQAEALPDRVRLRARDGRTFEAPLVVAADGVYSVVARRLGLNRGWQGAALALDMMEETPVDTLRCAEPGSLWVSYGHRGGEGYAYVFPKAAHVNVGIGYVLDYYRSRVGVPPYQLQRGLVEELCRRGVLEGRSSQAHFTPYQIPVGGVLPRTATSRVLLAGDAGGFVNGITAEGIYYAMVSGDLAARALAQGRPESYERLWRSEIGAELRDAVLVQRHLLRVPARIDTAVAAVARDRGPADRAIRYLMGLTPYAAARRGLVMAAPLAAARLVIAGLRGTTAQPD